MPQHNTEQDEMSEFNNLTALTEGDIIKIGKKEFQLLKVNHLLNKSDLICTTQQMQLNQDLKLSRFDSVLQ